jgi:hypothetical protein
LIEQTAEKIAYRATIVDAGAGSTQEQEDTAAKVIEQSMIVE